MAIKVKINNKNGDLIAFVEVSEDEFGNYAKIDSKNVNNIYHEQEQTDAQGFIDVLDVDINLNFDAEVLDSIVLVSKEIGAIEGAYETNEYGREKVVAQVVANILTEANKYDFPIRYIESEWDKKDNKYYDVELSDNDFYNANITDENYYKADYVISYFADEFLTYLKKQLI